jgi:molybdate transport system substrate-binding protein
MPSSTDVRPAAPARDLARCNRPGIAMRGASHPPMTPRPWFALALLCLASCREPAAGGKPVTVYAAASLSVAFEALGKEFAAQHPGASAKFVFEGSPSLVFKLQQGSRADVLATADRANMDKAVSSKLTDGEPVEFARNRLAILVARGNPEGIRGLADLARADVKVALCGPTVPAGRYAREALAKAGVTVASVSDENSVTALASKVRLREIDAGIAYATDARGEVEAVPIDPAHDVVASYPIALLVNGDQRDGGREFVAFVRSEAGKAILRAHGFVAP